MTSLARRIARRHAIDGPVRIPIERLPTRRPRRLTWRTVAIVVGVILVGLKIGGVL